MSAITRVHRRVFYVSTLLLAVACGAPKGTGAGGNSSDGGEGGDNGSDGGNSAGNGGSGGSDTPGTGGGFVDQPPPPPPDDNLEDGGACREFGAAGEVITNIITIEKPAAFYLMLDISGSMDDDCNGCNLGDKWSDAAAAITDFVQHPDSEGIKVALEFFAGDVCTGYETPVVEMGELPQNAPAIVDAIANAQTGGNTPTEGALRGLTTYCAQYMAQNPDDVCVAVFVTDGEPNGCNEDETALVQIVTDALATSEVRTFAVGMEGANLDFLDRISEAGNGDCDSTAGAPFACNATNGQDGLVAALQSIRETVTTMETVEIEIPCEWGIPPPPDGMMFDPDLVNVRFSQSGANQQSLGRVPSEAACAQYDGGWYYDDPASPENIRVCANTCTVIQSLDGAQVDILFGCASEPSILR